MIEKLINGRGTTRVEKITIGFLVLLIVVIFGAFYATRAIAIGSSRAGHEATLKGEVVVVDNLHKMGMLSLRSNEIGQYPNDRLNIFMNKDTKVKVCSEREPQNDIKVSHNATVTYHEVQGLLPLADSVTEKC